MIGCELRVVRIQMLIKLQKPVQIIMAGKTHGNGRHNHTTLLRPDFFRSHVIFFGE